MTAEASGPTLITRAQVKENVAIVEEAGRIPKRIRAQPKGENATSVGN